MAFYDQTLNEFTDALASKAAVPGGGGAAGLAAALGASLTSMVCNLTIGKKKFIPYEAELTAVLEEAGTLRKTLLDAIDADAEAFAPLAAAYSIPKDDPSRPGIMARALADAAEAPLKLMRSIVRVVELLEYLSGHCSALAVSDVGVAALMCRAALISASYNVYINTAMMEDRATAEAMENETDTLCKDYGPRAEAVAEAVLKQIKGA